MAADFRSSFISRVWTPACIWKTTALNQVPEQCDLLLQDFLLPPEYRQVDALLGQGPVAERSQVNKISAK